MFIVFDLLYINLAVKFQVNNIKMVCCCVSGCYSKYSGRHCKIRFFRLPKQPERKNTWLLFANNDLKSRFPNSKICELHFADNQFELHREDGRKLLKWNAVPTILPKWTFKNECNKTTGKALNNYLKSKTLNNYLESETIVLDDSDSEMKGIKKELQAANRKVKNLEKELKTANLKLQHFEKELEAAYSKIVDLQNITENLIKTDPVSF